jgi:threonine synthase
MGKMVGHRCAICGWEAIGLQLRYTCEACGGNLDVIYKLGSIRQEWSKSALASNPDPSIWRWLPLLPVEAAPEQRSLLVGNTPLVELPKLAALYDLDALWVKDDTRMPSGSLKDRASEVGVQHATEHDFDTIITASTGNAAASLACLSAWHGKKAVILVPSSAPPAKLAQIQQYGATLLPVNGSYDEAFDLSVQIADQLGLYCRSTGINSVMTEGKKTVALEIAEQCGWDVPDAVFVPVGDGCIIGGLHKGFSELFHIGWTEKIPKLIAVQATGSSAVADAIDHGGEITSVTSDTIADSISVDLPRDGAKAFRAVNETDGFAIRVTDEAILQAQHDLAKRTGIFVEPAAAAPWAALANAADQDLLTDERRVVVLATGTGLKDIAAARSMFTMPDAIEPSVDAITAAINGIRT